MYQLSVFGAKNLDSLALCSLGPESINPYASNALAFCSRHKCPRQKVVFNSC